MKNRILTLLLLFSGTACLVAQSLNLPSKAVEKNYNEIFFFGIKGGANFPRLYYTNPNVSDLPHDFMVGLSGSVFVEIPFTDQFALAPELNYQQRGGSTTYVYEQNYNVNYRLKADYVSVRLPVLFYFRTPVNVRPYVMLGPDVGYVVKGDIALSQPGLDIPESHVDLNKSNMKYISGGILGGVGVRVNIPMPHITLVVKVDAAVNFGLIDTFSSAEHNETATPTNVHAYNHQGKRLSRGLELNLSLGYIPWKKDDVCDHFNSIRAKRVGFN